MSSCRGRYRPPSRQPRAWMVTRRFSAKRMGSADVEPIGPKALLALVQAVLGDGVEAAVGGGELHIAAVGAGVLKIVGAAEVILGAGAADGGGLLVAVQVEFYLPFPHQPLLCTPQAMYVPRSGPGPAPRPGWCTPLCRAGGSPGGTGRGNRRRPGAPPPKV